MNPVQQNIFPTTTEPDSGVVNVASVPQRSPFRYPGGKTWFVPRLREWLGSLDETPEVLIEPFAGGGIVSLTAVAESLAESALMVELDEDVAAVWELVICGDSKWLAQKIISFDMSQENIMIELGKDARTLRQRAFKTILKNRCSHGGIMADGSGLIKTGESGRGILSRWYPNTLARRFKEIHQLHTRLGFRQEDAFYILEEYRDAVNAVFFIDPPYTAGGKKAGKRLYTHYDVNHDRLFGACVNLSGDFVMTYDNAPEVLKLASKYGLEVKPVSMKSTHHAQMTELVIGRNLDWMGKHATTARSDEQINSLGQ